MIICMSARVGIWWDGAKCQWSTVSIMGHSPWNTNAHNKQKLARNVEHVIRSTIS